MKISPVGAELLHKEGRTGRWTDGHTHMTKLIVFYAIFKTLLNNDHYK